MEKIIAQLETERAAVVSQRNAASARQKRARLEVEALNQRLIILDQKIYLEKNRAQFPNHTLLTPTKKD